MIYKALLVISAVLGYYYLNRFIDSWVENHGNLKQVSLARILYLQKVIRFGAFVLLLILIAFVLGFGYTELTFALSSVFAVLGVALFAQWSVLSNVTASVLIFFFFPFRPGDRIRVLENDCPEGEIIEISLFHLHIRTDDGILLTIPNTLVFQKSVLITARGDQPRPVSTNTEAMTELKETVTQK